MAVKYELKQELMDSVVNYLLSRPAKEVLFMLDEIRALRPVQVPDAPPVALVPESPGADAALEAAAE